MLKLVAENAAIEDALYHLDRAVASGATDCLSFLRVRRHITLWAEVRKDRMWERLESCEVEL
jgi:hypothetical protein